MKLDHIRGLQSELTAKVSMKKNMICAGKRGEKAYCGQFWCSWSDII